jgi:AcrR family transcriptional regulator
MARASKRNLVLDTAEMLFVQNGFAATGINQITQEAGIASMTLYNNFKSKDDLVLAVLDRKHKSVFEALDAAIAAAGNDPRDRILAIFDYLSEDVNSDDHSRHADGSFTGCAFSHAASEFRQLSHPIHQAAAEHKKQFLQRFEVLADEMEHPTPEAFAKTLLLLVDGALSSAQIMGDMTMFDRARAAAKALIDLSV